MIVSSLINLCHTIFSLINYYMNWLTSLHSSNGSLITNSRTVMRYGIYWYSPIPNPRKHWSQIKHTTSMVTSPSTNHTVLYHVYESKHAHKYTSHTQTHTQQQQQYITLPYMRKLILLMICLKIFVVYLDLIPYGGKLWWWETLANLANDRGFAKFIPAKFYPVKGSLTW